MNIAIAGASGHIHYILDAMEKDASLRVRAVCPGEPGEDITSLLRSLSGLGQAPTIYADVDSMLSARIDVLAAAAPLSFNAGIAMKGLAHGLPIFCEKPLALTLPDLDALLEAQKRADRPVCAMMGLRCDPHFAAAKKAMEDKRIGKVVLLSGQKSYRLGKRAAFYSQRETYGGTIPWIGIHAIDWAHWLTGKRFTDVTAVQSRIGNGGNGTMESAAAMLFQMEGGIPADIHIDFLRPAMAPTHGDDRVRIAGTLGVLEVSHQRATLLLHDHPPQILPPEEIPGGIFARFIGHLRGECENPVPTEQSFYCTAAALIAQIAADRGQSVSFSEMGWQA